MCGLLSGNVNLKVVDYIIVGQGLAGSCMAFQLLRQRLRLLVINQPDEHAASRVAAGLFNPVTGRKPTKTWMADKLFPYLDDFYTQAQTITKQKFYYPMPVYRPFVSVEEQNEWMGKSASKEFAPYVEQLFSTPHFKFEVHNPFGGLMLKHCGFLDTQKFLSAMRELILAENNVLEEIFREEELIVRPDGVEYRGWRASKIIFCGGVTAKRSPLFSWVPIRPLKGEILQLRVNAEIARIYNRGVFVVPGVWKAGSTYNSADITPQATDSARKELVNGLEALIRFPYEITGQVWGFRPTTPDRRPVLGSHPEFRNVIIFNGLGTKGVSLAPYFSNVLLQWLENGRPLNNEVDIQRYKSVYWKSA